MPTQSRRPPVRIALRPHRTFAGIRLRSPLPCARVALRSPLPFALIALLLAGCGGGPPETTGAAVYARNCAGCHGATGQADGPAAPFLYPRPRDFVRAAFKFGGAAADLERVVSRGVPGTSMPPFGNLLTEGEIAAVASHVRTLTGKPEPPADPAPVLPAEAERSVARGKMMYEDSCAKCHGVTGRGDGPSSRTMKDALGIPLRPVDLTSAPLKGGDRPEDIYLRIARGVPGTPMPAFEIPESMIWDMVTYVMSIRTVAPEAAPSDRVTVRTQTSLPPSPDSPAWEEAPAATLALRPLWQRPRWPPRVTVRAVRGAERVRFLLEWPDDTEDRGPGRVEDFVDAVAVMLPAGAGEVPFLGMGGSGGRAGGGPVARIWQWRATRADRAGDPVHPRLVRDDNPQESLPLARPAAVVGNPLASGGDGAPAPSLVEFVAAGPGTLTAVPASGQETHGDGDWAAGTWRVWFDLPGDLLPPGSHSLVALAVWNGAAGDRNGQKTITPWVRLEAPR